MAEKVNRETKLSKIDEHQKINQKLQSEEEIDYWQDKCLENKLSKLKKDFEYKKKKRSAEEHLSRESEINRELTEELGDLQQKVEELKNEDKENKERLSDLHSEIQAYEERNSNLYNEFMQRVNYIKSLENSENLMMHLLKFDRETLKGLCIRLNKMQNEKMNYFMNMQNQYYNQMYYNQSQAFYPGNMCMGMPMPNQNGAVNNQNEEKGE